MRTVKGSLPGPAGLAGRRCLAGIIDGVTNRVLSPVFAGREAEFALLARAAAAAAGGTPGAVLISAEAGGGKSRLVSEFTAALPDRALVLAGGCVELSAAGLPYAPFTAALRQLVRARGAAEVAALLPGQEAGELAALLPEFGTPPDGVDPDTARARLFELLLALLEALLTAVTGLDDATLTAAVRPAAAGNVLVGDAGRPGSS
jgi:AAA ATPase domain